MPFCCVVPKCRGNYDKDSKVSTFKFPRDPELRKMWIHAIKREGFTPSDSSRVCELHFNERDIKRTMSAFDERTGNYLTAPLKIPRLVKDAIPSKLPGCPEYLSAPSCSHRESPESKKLKKEFDSIKQAISESITASYIYNAERKFNNFEEAFTKINNNQNLIRWIISKQEKHIVFIYVEEIPNPVIKGLLYMNQDFNVTLEHFGNKVSSFNCSNHEKVKFPLFVDDMNKLEETLLEVQKYLSEKNEEQSVEKSCVIVTDTLEAMLNKLPEKQTEIKFIQEQVNLLKIQKKGAIRYSWETTLFCSLLFSISPHCYKFLRNSNHLILPCISTIKKVCSRFNTDPRVEQLDENFLKYVRTKFKHLQDNDKLITLMVDEIHLKPYFDFKGGNIVGAAYNVTESATSAHVFMINSLLSPYKDVVHILPVKTLNGESLHKFIKKVIEGLEGIGFEVLVVVTDNHAINRKSMSLFCNPPELLVEYPHPCNPTRPLFFVIDPVHILKNLRNNWINEPQQCMIYPDFENFHTTDISLKIASFQTIKDMHTQECDQLLKYGYTLSLKALYPNSLERQNVKLALQVLNKNIVVALRELGPKINLSNYDTTADYLEILCRWWDIVNVKTPFKGQRLRNIYQEPVTKDSHHIFNFFNKFLQWLENWQKCSGGGHLTKETHVAVAHTTLAFSKISNYCLLQKNIKYILLGQIQTDKLEDRFGKYRYQAGSQYHISIRQVFESESKLRMQSVIPLMLKSKKFGDLEISKDCLAEFVEDDKFENVNIAVELRNNCEVQEDDISKISDTIWPSIVYISGYAVFSLLKRLKCEYCKVFLVENDTDLNLRTELISANDRGGLCYPNQDVVTCASYTYLVMQKMLQNEECFLRHTNQRHVVMKLAVETIDGLDIDLFIGHSCSEHSQQYIINALIKTVSNVLLNNYVKKQNDILKPKTMPELKRSKPTKK